VLGVTRVITVPTAGRELGRARPLECALKSRGACIGSRPVKTFPVYLGLSFCFIINHEVH
jgi:hypothetical protein